MGTLVKVRVRVRFRVRVRVRVRVRPEAGWAPVVVLEHLVETPSVLLNP